MHTHAVILSTGDELILGQLQDTNAHWLAERLVERGIIPSRFETTGDDLNTLVDALDRASRAAPLTVITGGLGPTDGDLTRAALSTLTRQPLVTDEREDAALRAKLAARGREATPRQMRQAQRPERAVCLSNAVGTAPGLWLPADNTRGDIVCLPGPPGELRPMWAAHVLPRLRTDPNAIVRTKLLFIIGEAEADAADRIKDLTARGAQPVVNLTAHGGILTLRARFQGPTAEGGKLDATLADIRARFDGHIVAETDSGAHSGQHHLCSAIIELLKARGETLATIESCTGGLLGSMLTDIPGSSVAYLGGAVTYSNTLKASLAHVPADTIARHGAVSRETAEAMALGGLRTGASHSLSITGIAGPDGGSHDKPVGTVWIAHAHAGQAHARRFRFPGDRLDIRTRAATAALVMLWFALTQRNPGKLLWET